MAWTGQTFSVGQILTAAQMNNLQADITAVADGDSGAPRVTPRLALEEPAAGAVDSFLVAGTYVVSNSAYTFYTGCKIYAKGTVTLGLEHRSTAPSETSYARIIKNGVQVQEWTTTSTSFQTRTVDVAVEFGDIIKFETRNDLGGLGDDVEIRNARASADVAIFTEHYTGLRV